MTFPEIAIMLVATTPSIIAAWLAYSVMQIASSNHVAIDKINSKMNNRMDELISVARQLGYAEGRADTMKEDR